MVRSFGVLLLALVFLASHPVPAEAARDHFHEQQVPWGGLLVVCTSEPVLVTGTTHVNMVITIDERKGGMKARVMTKSRGTGIGASLATYTAQGNDHFWSTLDPTATEEVHLVLDVKLNSTGFAKQAPDHFFIRLKITYPAGGGTPTVQQDRFGCHGLPV